MLDFLNALNFIQNLDLLLVGFTIAAIVILGFAVFFNNPSNSTNKAFLLFSLIASTYSIINFLSYQVTTADSALWLIRLVISSAIWYAFLLFHFLYVYPQEDFKYPKLYKFIVIPLVIFTSIFNFTRYVFSGIHEPIIPGQVAQVIAAPGALLFAILSMGLVFGGFYILLKKLKSSEGLEKLQLKYIFTGTVLTYTLIIICNLILPIIFSNVSFVKLVPVFTIPFIALTAYTILRHHLLNIKVVATEIFTFLLSVATLFELLIAGDLKTLIFRCSLFVLVLGFSILLIKSVRNEVQQREQLEVLSKQLAEANEKLKALDQARSEFITIASHQLRTPPATIKWYLSALLAGDYGKFTKTQKEIINKTNTTNNSLISLIDDMLNVSRIERGKMEFLFEECDLLPLVQLTYEQLIPQAHDRKLELKFTPPSEPLPKIMADKEKIRQVMNNLIDNALKYTKEGTITIKIWQEGGEIKFSVTDTGKGIGPEEKQSIFSKFSRGKESVRQSAGLGLGLYVAKIVIEQHKGKIWADSPGPGLGSTFTFSLPIKNDLHTTTLLDLTQNQN